jgi:hypothetical protein
MSYLVVRFTGENTVGTVLTSWMDVDRNALSWPNLSKREHINALKMHQARDESWDRVFEFQIIYQTGW